VTAKARAAAAKRTCSTCGESFIGRAGAKFCGPACKQRAHRFRRAIRNAPRVTVTVAAADAASAHTAPALALLAELDAELAEKSAALELVGDDRLYWSAAEEAVRELIACTVDRKLDLWRRYHATDDDKTRVKLSAEQRLLETSLARLLKSVNTDLPIETRPSVRSQKASRAANARWHRAAY